MNFYKKLTFSCIAAGLGLAVCFPQFSALAADKGSINASGVNVRSKASTSGAIVTRLSKGTEVTMNGKSGSWYKISYKSYTGYVSSNYISTKSISAGKTSTQTGSTGTLLKYGSRGEAVKKLQTALKGKGVYQGKVDGIFGGSTESAVKAFQRKMGLKADGLAGTLTQDKLFGNNSSSGSRSSSSQNLTLKMGSKGAEVVKLQNTLKTKGYYTYKVTGTFGSITRTALVSFQKDAGLKADGIAGPLTLNKVYNSSIKKKTTTANRGETSRPETKPSQPTNDAPAAGNGAAEILNWFGSAEKVFSRGSIATVTDVRTGISFRVKRTGGTNHADVEPMTEQDTAALKKAYGGSWSWNRRPIWVSVNGRRLAASMNGMPHGYDRIPYNGMNGQICIHFKGSKTHGGGTVDSAHQSAIQEAYKAAQ